MAGSFVYNYDFAHRPHLGQQNYNALLNEWEAVGALVCEMPGFLLVGWSQFRSRREEQQEAATKRRAVGDEDKTVWPPPPRK